MKLTKSEQLYADQKTRFFGVNPTHEDFANTRAHMEGIKELVSIRPAGAPDQFGRVGGLYSWQQSPWD